MDAGKVGPMHAGSTTPPTEALWTGSSERIAEARRTPFPRTIPGLDGVRALAVALVLAYHAGIAGAGGGFFGVDVFFVLSGFLITSLLLDRRGRHGSISLASFWAGRARRLLPALLLMVNAVVLWTVFVLPPGALPSLRGDVVAALLYVANWHFVSTASNYFAGGATPSPLLHTWSLAIEEQFYLVWPIVLVLVLRMTRPLRRLGVLCAAGAVGSATVMAVLYRAGAPVSRLYYGTDTHAEPLLVGALLAVVLSGWAQRRGSWAPSSKARTAAVAAFAGVGALAALLVLANSMTGSGAFTYEGGYSLVSVAAAVLIWSVVAAPKGPVPSVLTRRPLRWLGRVSYGVYLWHYPVFVLVLTHASTGLAGWPLVAARLGLTLTLAAVSYYAVEAPIRSGRFWRRLGGFVAAVPAVAGSLLAALLLSPLPAVALPAPHDPAATRAGRTPVLLVGDSTAMTLGFDLSFDASHYGVDLVNGAIIGCGVTMGEEIRDDGNVGPMVAACNVASPADEQWPSQWAHRVGTVHPRVVAVLAGRWEVAEFYWRGRWTDILDSAFAAHVKADLGMAVDVAASAGAHVVLMTAPCYDSGEQPVGRPWPQDAPARVDTYNRLLRQVSSEHPATTSVYNLGGLVCPDGHFAHAIDGTTVRSPDGIHFPTFSIYSPDTASPDTEATAERFGTWISARLWPALLGPARALSARRG
jgi:peptidoglycan/LPS O-acetylase OafA/YrhL